jgi:hypothetical protein
VVSPDDEQMLRDMRYFTGELLRHADTLPADLAAMLRDYQSELRDSPPGRWAGMGDLAQGDCLAHRIGQSVTDGEWREGERLDSPAGNWRVRGETPGNFTRALRLLAARGEIVTRDGMYFTRSHDERP